MKTEMHLKEGILPHIAGVIKNRKGRAQ